MLVDLVSIHKGEKGERRERGKWHQWNVESGHVCKSAWIGWDWCGGKWNWGKGERMGSGCLVVEEEEGIGDLGSDTKGLGMNGRIKAGWNGSFFACLVTSKR